MPTSARPVCLLGLLLVSACTGGTPRRDPRTQALVPSHALLAIPNARSGIVLSPDLDGDGLEDLVVPRDWPPVGIDSVEVLSSVTGRTLKTVWVSIAGSSPEGEFDLDGDGVLDVRLRRQPTAWKYPKVYLTRLDQSPEPSVIRGQGESIVAGDFDSDGTADRLADGSGSVLGVSGRTGTTLFELSYPDPLTDFPLAVHLGDLDGDGVSEFAIGDANFGLRAPGWRGILPWSAPDPEDAELSRMLEVKTEPKSMAQDEGCALVYSGRTREVILGVWAEADSHRGLGLDIVALPDIDADGWRDILVSDTNTAYLFSGPGPAR